MCVFWKGKVWPSHTRRHFRRDVVLSNIFKRQIHVPLCCVCKRECVCACARDSARARMCVCVCMCACVWLCVYVWVWVCENGCVRQSLALMFECFTWTRKSVIAKKKRPKKKTETVCNLPPSSPRSSTAAAAGAGAGAAGAAGAAWVVLVKSGNHAFAAATHVLWRHSENY